MFAGSFEGRENANPVRDALFPWLTPPDVAAAAWRAVAARRNAVVVLPGIMAWIITWARALLPLPLLDAFIGYMGGWHGMTHWRGKDAVGAAAGSAPAVPDVATMPARDDPDGAPVGAAGRGGGSAGRRRK
jgi:hypothetical protein